MNKSAIFKVAHAVAKAAKTAKGGNYASYLKEALIATYKFVSKGASVERLYAAANAKLATANLAPVFMKKVVKSTTHGVVSFKKEYEFKKAAKDLKDGQRFGEIFFKNGMLNAWVKSEMVVEEAY